MIQAYSKSFREFLTRGDAIAIGVAFLLALAVYSFLQTLVEGLIEPLVAAIFDEPTLYMLNFKVNGNEVTYGNVLVGLISLVLVFLVAVGVSKVQKGAASSSSGT